MKLPIDDILKALFEAGTPLEDVAKTLAKLMREGGDEAAKVADEVIPAPKGASVVPKLVAEGAPLPAKDKIIAAKKPKFVRPQFDDTVHAGTDEKFSDIMTKEEFDAASDADLKFTRNSRAHADDTEARRLAGRQAKIDKKAANKAAHAATRTPEARRQAAAAQAEYFKNKKKGDK